MIPTSTNVIAQLKPTPPANADATVVFVTQETKPDAAGDGLADVERRGVRRLLAAEVVRGKSRELAFDLVDGAANGKPRRVYVVGLGPAAKVTTEVLRQAAATVAKAGSRQTQRWMTLVCTRRVATRPPISSRWSRQKARKRGKTSALERSRLGAAQPERAG